MLQSSLACRGKASKDASFGGWLPVRASQRLDLLRWLVLSVFFTVPLAFGVQRWERWYGGFDEEWGHDVQVTPDGGYIIAGSSRTLGGSGAILWLVKTDSFGDTLWTQTWRPPDWVLSEARSVVQTRGGGFAAAGYAWWGGNPDTLCICVVRTDSNGHILWTRLYPRPGCWTDAWSMRETRDGGFIMAGHATTWHDTVTHAPNAYALRLDSAGDTLWTKCFTGDTSNGEVIDVEQTADGGFVFAGNVATAARPDGQGFLARTDSTGSVLWLRSYGPSSSAEGFSSVRITSDDGFVAAGGSQPDIASSDFYVVRTDSLGSTLWSRTYGGAWNDYCSGLCLTGDGGFAFAGQTMSYGTGGSDAWLLRTRDNGDTAWAKTFGGSQQDFAERIQQTPDGGFIMVGATSSFGSGASDIYLVKTDANGSAAIVQTPTANRAGTDGKLKLAVPSHVRGGQVAKYYLAESGCARLEAFDVLGRAILVLAVGTQNAGWHEVTLPTKLPSASYFIRLSTTEGGVTQRFVMVK